MEFRKKTLEIIRLRFINLLINFIFYKVLPIYNVVYIMKYDLRSSTIYENDECDKRERMTLYGYMSLKLADTYFPF